MSKLQEIEDQSAAVQSPGLPAGCQLPHCGGTESLLQAVKGD